MQRADRRRIVQLVALVATLVLMCCVPELRGYANAHRALPGIGGEVLVPFFPALIAMLWECCEDMKEAASSGEGGETDEDER